MRNFIDMVTESVEKYTPVGGEKPVYRDGVLLGFRNIRYDNQARDVLKNVGIAFDRVYTNKSGLFLHYNEGGHNVAVLSLDQDVLSILRRPDPLPTE